VSGIKQAESTFRSGASSITASASRITGSLTRLIGVGAGLYALKRGIQSAVGAFASFDEALRNVWTLTDATWEQMQKVGQEVRDLAPKFGIAGTEATKALYQIYSAGYKGAEGIEVLKASLIGAAAGLTDVFTAADATTSILNAYKMSADKASYVNDVLFKTVERGKTTFGELSSSIGRLIGIAAPLGAGFEEVTAALATLTRQGISTDEAVTAVRQAIVQLARPTEETAKVIEALGYESGAAMMEELGFAEALAEVTDYAKEHNIELSDMFTNIRAVLAVLPLATTSAGEYAEDMKEIANATGAAAAAFEKQKGLAFQLRQVKAYFAEVATTLGETFLPEISKLLRIVQSIIGPLSKMGDALKHIVTVLGTTTLGALFGGLSGGVIGGIIGGLIVLVNMIKDLVDTMRELGTGIEPIDVETAKTEILKTIKEQQEAVEAAMQMPEGPEKPIPPEELEITAPLPYTLGIDRVEQQSEVLEQTTEDFADTLQEGAENIVEAARQIAEAAGLTEFEIEPSPTLTIEEASQAIRNYAEKMGKLKSVTGEAADTAEEAASTTEKAADATEEAAKKWQEELDKLTDQLAEDPIKAVSALTEFIGTFKGIPSAMLAAADTAETLIGILEDWLALPAEMRAGAGISETDVQGLIEQLKEYTIQIEQTKSRQEEWAKQWDKWIKQLDDGTLSIEEFIGIVQDHMRANADDAEQLVYHYQRLQDLENRYEMLVPILESLGLSSEEAESAAQALANALGNATSAAQSLADQLNALSLANIGDIIPRAGEIVEKLRTGDVENVGEWLKLWGELQALKGGVEAFREGLYRVGAGAGDLQNSVEVLKKYIDSVTSGKTPEEIAEERRREAERLKREAEKARREREKAAREAQRAAEEAAREAQEAFKRKFDLPALGALATGDWEGAAKAVHEMAQMYDDLVQEAQALAEVNGKRLDERDVLQLLMGAERQLLSALQDRIRLAQLAGKFDLAAELQKQYERIKESFTLPEGLRSAFDEIRATWKADATGAGEQLRKLAETFDPTLVAKFLDELVSEAEDEIRIMEKFGQDTTKAAKALNDLQVAARGGLTWWEKAQEKFGWAAEGLDILNEALSAMGDIPKAISTAIAGARSAIDSLFKGDVKQAIITGLQTVFAVVIAALQEKKAQLEKIMDFYISSFKQLGSAIAGLVQSLSLGLGGPLSGLFGALMAAITSAIKMTFLSGVELLTEGINMLVGFIGQLASSFANLIKQSEAYSALQKETDSVWKAIADLFGEFLWPLVAIIRHLKEWLGIQDEVNRQVASSLNVPVGWKAERIRYGAATPGEPLLETTAGTEVPAWADAVGKKIAEYIMNLLQGFGIDSWTDLLSAFRDAAVGMWDWLTGKMPDIIESISGAIATVGEVLAKHGVSLDSIAEWLAKGVDWVIQNLPQIAADITEFILGLFKLGKDVWNWVVRNFPSWDDIRGAFDRFIDELDKLPSWDQVRTSLDRLIGTLNALKAGLIYAMFGAAGALIGAMAAMNPIMGWAAIGGAALGVAGGIGLAYLLHQWLGTFAGGGIAMKPGFARIGEAGPEAVLPLSKLPEFMGKENQGPFIFNIHIGNEKIARVVLRELRRDNNVASGYNLAPLGV